MTLTGTPEIGSWVWGKAEHPCQVLNIGTQRSSGQTVLKVKGIRGQKIIPLGVVQGCSLTKPTSEPSQKPLEQKGIETGDIVMLKGTDRIYKLERIYQIYSGEGTYESWAELKTSNGGPAFWMTQQLVKILH